MAMNLGSFASRVVATKVVALDGTGDFTDIQSAIDDLPAGGGVVYIKEGTYTITTAIIINVSNTAIIGAGKSTKISTSIDDKMIYALSKSGIYLSQFYVYGAGAGKDGNYGIILETCTDCVLDGVWVEHCGGSGIYISGGSGNFIISCHSSSNSGNGIYPESSPGTIVIGCVCKSNGYSGIEAQSNDTVISNNYCSGNSEAGIEVYYGDRQVVTSNISVSNKYGINIASSSTGTIVVSNSCTSNSTSQIINNGSGTVIDHNYTG